jgi:hypothetical protein
MKKDNILEKAGWSKFQKKEFPYLVDTGIYLKHVDQDGKLWPQSLPKDFVNRKKTWAECMEP